jgi:hypothetical protein
VALADAMDEKKKRCALEIEIACAVTHVLASVTKKSNFFTYGNHQIYSTEPDPEPFRRDRVLVWMRCSKLFSTTVVESRFCQVEMGTVLSLSFTTG